MERDFESEFREWKQNEIPDLWNRIESSLPEKKITAALPGQKNAAADAGRYVPKKKTAWRNWGILIAACFCVVILLPAVVTGLAGGNKSSGAGLMPSDSVSSSDTSIEEAGSSFADAAKEPEESVAGGMAESAAAEGIADAPVVEGEGTESGSAESNAESTGANSGGEAVAPAWTELEDGQVLEDVVVEVTQASMQESENVYTAVVEQGDSDGMLESGTQIAIICNADTQYGFPRAAREEQVLKVGKQYVMTLWFDAGRSVIVDGVLMFYGSEVDVWE